MGHGLALMMAPTSVVLVGGLAIAKVGYDKYLRFVWPLLLALFVVSTAIIGAGRDLRRDGIDVASAPPSTWRPPRFEELPGSLPVSVECLWPTIRPVVPKPVVRHAGAAGPAVGLPAHGRSPAPEIRPVRAMTIDKRATSGTVALTGTVQAQTEINQSFRIDGRLVERTVDVGDNVKPGQLIARLDPQNEESGLQSARAQLAGANAQLVEARSNYNRMRRTGGRGCGLARPVRAGQGAAASRPRRRSQSVQGAAQPGAEPAELHAAVLRRGRRGHGARAAARRGGVGRAHDHPGGARRRARCGLRRAGADQGQRAAGPRGHGRRRKAGTPAAARGPDIAVTLGTDPRSRPRAGCARSRRAPTR